MEEEKPPKPDTGREYVWLDFMKSWFDITPKEQDLVTFIKIKKEEDDE